MKSSQIRDRSKMKERDNRKTQWEKIKYFSFLSIILFCSLTSISMNKSLFWKPYNLTIASSKLDFTDLKQTANLSIWNKTCKVFLFIRILYFYLSSDSRWSYFS